MNDLDELNFTPLPPVTDQDLAMVRGVVNSNRLHMIKGLASVPLSEEFDFLGCDGRPIRIPDSVRHPGHKLEGAAQAAHMLRLTLTGDPKWIGNGVLDRFLEDESLFGEFLRTPVSEGGVEPLVVEPPHVVVEVGA